MKVNGIIDKFKARFIEKGYIRNHEIDYFDAYAQVAKIATSTSRFISNFQANYSQIDAKMAFLNGKLDEEIYITQPKRFVALG